MNKLAFSVLFLLSTCISVTYSQSIIADFDFENCTVTDNTGNYTDNFVRDNINCECGVDGPGSQSLIFDGSADTIFLDSDLKEVFLQDFSLSFYFWVDDATDEYPIMSIRSECTKDSSFLIRYLPFSQDIEVEFTANALDGMFLRTDVNPDICWHHFLLTRSDKEFNFFLDGKFVATFIEFTTLALGVDHQVTLGYSPCIDATNSNSDIFFRGRLDNLQFYDTAITSEAGRDALLINPDQILTSDTTIFMGDVIDIISGPTCAATINWTPNNDLSDINSASPQASPDQTVNYKIDYDHGTCVSTDMIRISVVDTDAIDCSTIIFPTAFTPNNDQLNDEFYISNAFIIESLSRFQIYDRWGLLLYSSLNKNERWDGTYNGANMPPGVYVYKIEYTCGGENYQKAGSFNILK
jgi:gliding motility-associated-like protein